MKEISIKFQMRNTEPKKISVVIVSAIIMLAIFAVFIDDMPYNAKAEKKKQLTTFSDGTLTKKFVFGDIPPGNETAYIKLPEDANVINATMDVAGLAHKLRETLSGENAGDEFGFSVSYAGDVNNDSYDDIIVGVPYKDTNGNDSGRVYIFHGMASGIASSPNTTLDGENAYDFFGVSVSCAGDVNDDGYDDIIIGANASDGDNPNPDFNCGRIYVYPGSENGITTPAAIMINGGWEGWEFGYSVSTAGDVNNDGYDDIIVGAPLSNFGSSDGGEMYIYHGSSSGISSQIKGRYCGTTGDHLGNSVSTAGDVNNDGFDDVIVGAYLANTGGGDYDEGKGFVFHGSSSGIIAQPNKTLEGENDYDHFGHSVSYAGDVNNDGYDDVIVGADEAYKSGADGRPGKVYVFHGSSNGVYTTANTTVIGKKDNDHFGISVSYAGDVNNDGYDDIITGAHHAKEKRGRVYVYHGTINGVTTEPTPILEGEYRNDEFGCSVSYAGDVNNDGYDDIVVSAPLFNASGKNSGKVYLYRSSVSGIEDTPSTFYDGKNISEWLGCSVSYAGDVNNDGYDDVIVGAYMYTNLAEGKNESGAIYIFHGSASGISKIPTLKILGEGDYYHLGCSVSFAGDVDNDGYDDVVVGAYGYDTNRGRVYVFYGSEIGIDPSSNTTIDGSKANEQFGFSVSYAGDVNNDTYDDVIIGANNYSSPPERGRIYVYHGSDSGLDTTPAAIINGEVKYDHFGNSVSNAGDVNNDGYDDVVAAAYDHDYSTGKIYVYKGSADGIITTPINTVDGENSEDYFGHSVSYAGDVNNDGYDDIIVGVPRFDVGGVETTGKVYIYHGSSSGIDIPAATTIDGDEYYGYFGCSVSYAGDLNNDYYDDIIVGAHRRRENQQGKISIYNGSSSGILTSASTVIKGDDEGDQFGYSVSSAGDVNNDSYIDIIIGAPQAETRAVERDRGRMHVYYNGNAGIFDWDSDYYPYNPRIDVGADGDYEWSYDGYFNSEEAGIKEVSNFSAELNDYLDNHQDEADEEGNILVLINVTCDFRGAIELSNLDISYIHIQPPTNLMAIIAGNDIELTWNASISPGVDHYNIYRSTNIFSFNYSIPFAQTTETNWTDSGAVADTSTNYFYVVRTVNNRGNIDGNTDKAGKFVRYLSEGKQLVSIPLVQFNNNVSEVLKTIDGSYDHVQWYDPLSTEDNWMSYSSFKPQGLNNLLHIDHTIAIWITMTSPDYLTIAGKVPNNTTIQLYKGWNFVGYPSLTNRTVGDALGDVWENVTQVEGFNDTNIPYYLETLSEDDMMIAGHGYWICITNDCVWMVEN